MIILHFQLQPQLEYELFHIYFTSDLHKATNKSDPSLEEDTSCASFIWK